MRDEPAQERQVRDHALDLGLCERGAEPVERLGARVAVGDQLRDHRVVGEPDLVAFLDARVHADTRRQPKPRQLPGLRQERLRILRVEAHLDRMALQRGRPGQRTPLGELDLRRDEVEPRDELGDRMLDLDPAVQLEEEELAPVEHELRGPGAAVADPLGEGDCGGAHRGAQLGVERG